MDRGSRRRPARLGATGAPGVPHACGSHHWICYPQDASRAAACIRILLPDGPSPPNRALRRRRGRARSDGAVNNATTFGLQVCWSGRCRRRTSLAKPAAIPAEKDRVDATRSILRRQPMFPCRRVQLRTRGVRAAPALEACLSQGYHRLMSDSDSGIICVWPASRQLSGRCAPTRAAFALPTWRRSATTTLGRRDGRAAATGSIARPGPETRGSTSRTTEARPRRTR